MLDDEDRKSRDVINRLKELNLSNKTLKKGKMLDKWLGALMNDGIEGSQCNSQIDRLKATTIIALGKEKTTFSLTKKNNKWQITGLSGDIP